MDMLTHESQYRGAALVAKFAGFKIVICGAGALGANLCENLVRQGFRSITVIDRDRVELHNRATQPYGTRDVGVFKAYALANNIFRSLDVAINAKALELQAKNIDSGILSGCDLVVDTFDNPESRLLVTEWCLKNKMNCIHAGMSGDGYGEVVWNEHYRVPKRTGPDICDYPLARNLVMFTVTLTSEAIIEFVASGKKQGCVLTLKDKKVSLV